MHSTNDGESWLTQSSGTTNQLYSVNFIDATTGWAVGDIGTILHTTNGGESWLNQISGASDYLYSVAFINASTGWAVGWYGTIFHTTNGGESWIIQPSGTNYYLNSVTFTDANNGWIVGGYGTILHTSTGGTTWAPDERTNNLPKGFSLENNYPNPFNSRTTLFFSLPRAGRAKLTVYDLLGRNVATVFDGYQPAGEQHIPFDAKSLASGIYLYRLHSGSHSETRKFTVIR